MFFCECNQLRHSQISLASIHILVSYFQDKKGLSSLQFSVFSSMQKWTLFFWFYGTFSHVSRKELHVRRRLSSSMTKNSNFHTFPRERAYLFLSSRTLKHFGQIPFPSLLLQELAYKSSSTKFHEMICVMIKKKCRKLVVSFGMYPKKRRSLLTKND